MSEDILPAQEDMEMYSNGAIFVRTYFVTKQIDANDYSAFDKKAKLAGAINSHMHGNLFNAMFRSESDAKAFAKSL